MTARNSRQGLAQRAMRLRRQLKKRNSGRPRLSVFRSGKNIYAQVIDDAQGVTLAQASTMDPELREQVTKGSDTTAAEKVGALLALRAKDKGVTDVVFDRGGYRFHGRVKALADAAREGGLNF